MILLYHLIKVIASQDIYLESILVYERECAAAGFIDPLSMAFDCFFSSCIFFYDMDTFFKDASCFIKASEGVKTSVNGDVSIGGCKAVGAYGVEKIFH
jgi:hypothetical protein